MIWFFLGSLVFLAALGGLYWRWARRVEAELAEGAEIEWGRIAEDDPGLIEGMDRAAFDRIYRRVHFPRFPGYALACVAAFVVSLPLTFAALSGGLAAADAFGLTPEPAEVADRFLVEDGRMRIIKSATPEAALYYVEDLGGFYYFFGVLAVWLLIVAFFTRRYHARRPGYLRDEILRGR